MLRKRLFVILLILLFVGLCTWETPSSYSQTYTQTDVPFRGSVFGVNSHVASRSDYHVMEQPVHLIDISGAGWVREDFHWAWIEPQPGNFQWERFDRMVELLTARGINIIGVLGHPPGWATPEPYDNASDVSFFAPDPYYFKQYAVEVVKRYRGKVSHWEIWNEPDNPQFWKPHPDPVAYAHLLREVSPAIKDVAPESTVLIGGINPYDPAFLKTVAENDAWWAFDILNIHPYVNPALPEENGEIGSSAMANLGTITRWAGEKPVWATEYGWSSRPDARDPFGRANEDDQANYLVRGAALLRAAGVQRVIWYSFKDEVHNGYGMLRFAEYHDDYSQLRPAFNAFTVLNTHLGSATFEGHLPRVVLAGQDHEVYTLRFVRNGQPVDVVWSVTPAAILMPTDYKEVVVSNRDGDVWTERAERGMLRLYPDHSPIYITPPQ